MHNIIKHPILEKQSKNVSGSFFHRKNRPKTKVCFTVPAGSRHTVFERGERSGNAWAFFAISWFFWSLLASSVKFLNQCMGMYNCIMYMQKMCESFGCCNKFLESVLSPTSMLHKVFAIWKYFIYLIQPFSDNTSTVLKCTSEIKGTLSGSWLQEYTWTSLVDPELDTRDGEALKAKFLSSLLLSAPFLNSFPLLGGQPCWWTNLILITYHSKWLAYTETENKDIKLKSELVVSTPLIRYSVRHTPRTEAHISLVQTHKT